RHHLGQANDIGRQHLHLHNIFSGFSAELSLPDRRPELKTRDRTELHRRQRIKLPLSSQCTSSARERSCGGTVARKRGDQFGTEVDNLTGCAYHFVSSQGGCVMRVLRFVILLLGL